MIEEKGASAPPATGGKEEKAFKSGHSKKFSHYPSKAPDAWDGESIEVSVSAIEFFEDE